MRCAHPLGGAVLVSVALWMGVACSKSSGGPGSDGGAPGEAFTACQIQGYVSELEGGVCPQGTCAVRAFDTNGGLLPCCTSVVSGPGMCIDADAADLMEGSEANADAGGDADGG